MFAELQRKKIIGAKWETVPCHEFKLITSHANILSPTGISPFSFPDLGRTKSRLSIFSLYFQPINTYVLKKTLDFFPSSVDAILSICQMPPVKKVAVFIRANWKNGRGSTFGHSDPTANIPWENNCFSLFDRAVIWPLWSKINCSGLFDRFGPSPYY